jgi:hypothetical protein
MADRFFIGADDGVYPFQWDSVGPYLANQDPAPGDTYVLLDTNVALDIKDDLTGVDPTETIITIAGTIAWQSDTIQPGFTGSKSGTPASYTYTINPDLDFPELTLIQIDVYAKDVAGNTLNTSYTFTTGTVHDLAGWGYLTWGSGVWGDGHVRSGAVVNNNQIFVVAKDVLRINLATNIISTPAFYDTNNYIITALDGGRDSEVLEVLPAQGKIIDKFFLKVAPPELGKQYMLTIRDYYLFDQTGLPLVGIYGNWTAHRTKVDSVNSSLARMYNTKIGGNLRSIVEAIMISDEEIGGDY